MSLCFYNPQSTRFFVEELWQKEFAPASNDGFGNLYGYHPPTQAVWSLGDPFSGCVLREEKGIAWRLAFWAKTNVQERCRTVTFKPLFSVRNAGSPGLVLFPRQNVTVAVQYRSRLVYKVLNPEGHQREMLRNERMAAQWLKEHVPPLIEYSEGEAGCCGYTVHGYAPDDEPIQEKEWAGVLNELLPRLADLYRFSGIEEHSLGQYVQRVDSEVRRKAAGRSSIFVQEGLKIADIVRDYLDNMPADIYSMRAFTAFTHGDLLWDNVRRSNGRLILIDWGAAGRTNIFADLFRLEFRLSGQEEALLYDNLRTGTFESHFYGWHKPFLRTVEELVRHHFTPVEIHANLLCSCQEKVSALLTKWQTNEEIGAKMLRPLWRFLPPDYEG